MTKIKIQKGITLIELLVAITIFSLIISVILGIFISTMRTQKRILDYQEVLNQANYAIEYMSRAIRMARKDINGNCIPAGTNYELTHNGEGIRFLTYNNICSGFYLANGKIIGIRERRTYDLTMPAFFDVARLNFNIMVEERDDFLQQPRVTLIFEAEKRDVGRIALQTTISQRNLDTQQ